MSLVQNLTKKKLRAGEVALGFGVNHLRTTATALLAAAADHDWLFLDLEHGAFSIHEVTQICIATLATPVTPIVRVCAGALDEGTRALDNGAMGIIVPHVDTVEEARRIDQAFRYPPAGTRSWGGTPVQFGYQAPGIAEAQARVNDEILVIAMIESAEGAANADAIAAVDGIDGLLIGASDMSADMGIAGQILHPRMRDAFESIGASCRAHGKFMGMGGVYEPDATALYMKAGARFILTGSDHSYLLAGATQRATSLREQAKSVIA